MTINNHRGTSGLDSWLDYLNHLDLYCCCTFHSIVESLIYLLFVLLKYHLPYPAYKRRPVFFLILVFDGADFLPALKRRGFQFVMLMGALVFLVVSLLSAPDTPLCMASLLVLIPWLVLRGGISCPA